MLTLENPQRRLTVWNLLKAQWRVLVALMLRDIKTRWGSSLGFVITILWPLSHILILVGIYISFGRAAPYGDSAILWFALSMVPFMIFSYVSRFVMLGIIINKALLVFPAIKVTDILFSRVIIEVVNIAILILCLAMILWWMDVDFVPNDPKNAAYALGVSILFALGAGIINALIGAIYPMWITGYTLLTIVLWITSGVLFIPSNMPSYLRDWLYFQPTVHLVEWMREAYYPGYNSLILDKTLITCWSGVSIAYGLFIERIARGRIVVN